MAGQGSQRRFFRGPDHRLSNGVIVVEIPGSSGPVRCCAWVKTRCTGPEELVASKIFVAKRERFDGADIAHVIYGTYGAFDWERELKLVGEHWECFVVAASVSLRVSRPDPLRSSRDMRKLLRGFETQIAKRLS